MYGPMSSCKNLYGLPGVQIFVPWRYRAYAPSKQVGRRRKGIIIFNYLYQTLKPRFNLNIRPCLILYYVRNLTLDTYHTRLCTKNSLCSNHRLVPKEKETVCRICMCLCILIYTYIMYIFICCMCILCFLLQYP